jgi:hypothetical protein
MISKTNFRVKQLVCACYGARLIITKLSCKIISMNIMVLLNYYQCRCVSIHVVSIVCVGVRAL